MAIITLTTDFGTRDGYVGAMKGVIARLAPEARVVDISHEVPRHDIAHGAWVLATACREFPAGTIHVGVVDPGVGSARREVIVASDGQLYVGPDNGLFALVAGDDAVSWAIEAVAFRAADVSATFHGRDVFATAAAMLTWGRAPDGAGPRVTLAGQLPWGPRPAGEGRVVHVDGFGNLVTDLPPDEAGEAVAVAGRRLPVVRTYADVPPGELLAYAGSAGTIEIAVREGRADRALEAPRGTRVIPVASGDGYR